MAGAGQFMSPANLLMVDSCEIDGGSLAAVNLFDCAIVVLNAADAYGDTSRFDNEFVTDASLAASDAPGDDRAVSGDGKTAIDGHPERAGGCGTHAGGLSGRLLQDLLEFLDPGTGRGAGAHQRSGLEKRSLNQLAHFFFNQIDPTGFREVALREDQDAGGQIEHPENVEVFSGLAVDRVIRGDDEEGQIHPGGSSQHVANESFVTWDIDDAKSVGADDEFGEAQFDRDAPFFFFGKSVGVDAREGSNKRRLAVIDVSGGSQDEVGRHGWCFGGGGVGVSLGGTRDGFECVTRPVDVVLLHPP